MDNKRKEINMQTQIINRELRLKEVFAYGERKIKNLRIKESEIEKLVDEYREGR